MKEMPVVDNTREEIRVEMPLFPTHVQVSKNKFYKINGQLIWSSKNYFLRAEIKRKLSEFVYPFLPKDIKMRESEYLDISMEFYVPINYGSVRISKKKAQTPQVLWTPPKKDKVYKWDLNNYGWIWFKVFNDCLVDKHLITDDSVDVIRRDGCCTFIPVKKLTDRKIVFIIKKFTI